MKRHGTSGSYRSGCRCDACVSWNRERSGRYRELDRDLQPVTLGLPVSCATCGGPVSILAPGRPSVSGTETSAVVKCGRPGCSRSWRLSVVLRSLEEKELALEGSR